MRAALIEELGRPPVLEEVDEPKRAPGQALVAPAAVPLNPIDIATANGTFYGGHPEPPYIPGSEGVGRVLEADSVGTGSLFYFSGDGLGRKRDGTLAERSVVAEDVMFALPDEISPELAGACGTAGMSGWLPVTWRAKVTREDRVLVLGATGTVGLTAVQASKLLGAERVVAAGRRPEGLEQAAELGADAVVNLNEDDLPRAFREAAGGEGPTVVIDPLWGAPAVAALEAAANGARIVQLGQSAGASAEILSATVRGKQLEILGYANPQLPLEIRRTAYGELIGHAVAGRIRFPIETYPFDRTPEAWERQASGHPAAKIVVTI